MAPKVEQPAEPSVFPVSLAEFMSTIHIGQTESRAAFAHMLAQEKISGHKLPAEWQAMFEKFKTKPMGVSWADWTKAEPETIPAEGGKE